MSLRFLLLFTLVTLYNNCFITVDGQDCAKNPRLPTCRNVPLSEHKTCEPYYLIPGKANECGRKVGGRYLSIDSSSVIITGDENDDIKLPGCFKIQFNVEILDASNLQQSYLAKVSFDWLNLKEFSDLPCQNESSNGCNGVGNNCYYCDVCNSLKQIKDDPKVTDNKLAKQFTDVNCPTRPGIYMLKREFCFKDFKDLDKNNNCQLDFLEGNDGQQYKKALDNLQQSGFGTVIAKFDLATNATPEQNKDKAAKIQEIELQANKELTAKRQENNWAINDGEYATFKTFFIKGRVDLWYKKEFLPRLLNENEVGCLAASFTVCDRKPIRVNGQKICPPKNSWLD